MLDDAGDIVARVAHDPPVPARIVQVRGQHGEAAAPRFPQPLQGLGAHERDVAIQDQHVGIAREVRHRLLYCVAGPELLGLQHPLDVGVGERSAHRLGAVAVDHDHLARLERARRGEHVGEQRPAGERMQDLGQLRAHALALARRENENF